MLAGQLPFEGTSLQQKLLSATFAARPSLLKYRPELPREVDSWVGQALAVDREQRFASVRALWDGLLDALQLAPPGARRRGSLWAAAKGAVRRISGRPRAG